MVEPQCCCPNESFTFAYFDYQQEFDKFMRDAQASVNAVRTGTRAFQAVWTVTIGFTLPCCPGSRLRALPTPATRRGQSQFPKSLSESSSVRRGHTHLPVSVEVHHAMMDGLHVGRFFNRFEEMLAEPEVYIAC